MPGLKKISPKVEEARREENRRTLEWIRGQRGTKAILRVK